MGLIFINAASHFGAQSTKEGNLCDWHSHYCLFCSLLLQVWCEFEMWLKLITQPSPKLTVQAVLPNSGEPLTDGAPHAIAATPLPSALLYGQTGQEQPLPRSQQLPFKSQLTHFRPSGLQGIEFSLHSFLCPTASALPFVLTLAPTIQHCRPPEKHRDITKRSKQSNFPWKGEQGKMHLRSFSNQQKGVLWNH